MSENKCGGCTLCCKVLGIAELAKPTGQWCPHCEKGRGCGLYNTPQKPHSCNEYMCVWRQSLEGDERAMPLALRPDHCHVVMTAPEANPAMKSPDIVAHCDPAYPDAWRAGAIGALFMRMASTRVGMSVIVGNGKGHWLIEKGYSRKLIMTKPDALGVQYVEGFAES